MAQGSARRCLAPVSSPILETLWHWASFFHHSPLEQWFLLSPPQLDAWPWRSLRRAFSRCLARGHPSFETKFLLVALLALGSLATWAESEAVLPAYIIGMTLANAVGKDHALIRRLRTVTFGVLTPSFLSARAILCRYRQSSPRRSRSSRSFWERSPPRASQYIPSQIFWLSTCRRHVFRPPDVVGTGVWRESRPCMDCRMALSIEANIRCSWARSSHPASFRQWSPAISLCPITSCPRRSPRNCLRANNQGNL